METIRVEIKDKKAWKTLRRMEASNLIGLDSDKKSGAGTLKLSDRYKGKLSAKTAELLSRKVIADRKEWEG